MQAHQKQLKVDSLERCHSCFCPERNNKFLKLLFSLIKVLYDFELIICSQMSGQNGGLACTQNTFVHFKEFVLFQFRLGIFLTRKDKEKVSFYMYLV